MPSMTLEDLNRAADKKYGNFEIEIPGEETLVFLSPLRLPKDRRKAMTRIFETEILAARIEKEEDLDQYDLYAEAFSVAAEKPAHYERLAALVGDEPAKWTVLFESYNGTAEVGEA